VPTLTNQTTSINNGQISDGYTLNLTTDGTCTGTDYTQCSVRSNSTLGSIIPPVRSARITTKGKKTIKYGKVEVIAKLPKGDWLWPAIWYDTQLK
jgi:beta-glucanase (GH16 family)